MGNKKIVKWKYRRRPTFQTFQTKCKIEESYKYHQCPVHSESTNQPIRRETQNYMERSPEARSNAILTHELSKRRCDSVWSRGEVHNDRSYNDKRQVYVFNEGSRFFRLNSNYPTRNEMSSPEREGSALETAVPLYNSFAASISAALSISFFSLFSLSFHSFFFGGCHV